MDHATDEVGIDAVLESGRRNYVAQSRFRRRNRQLRKRIRFLGGHAQVVFKMINVSCGHVDVAFVIGRQIKAGHSAHRNMTFVRNRESVVQDRDLSTPCGQGK